MVNFKVCQSCNVSKTDDAYIGSSKECFRCVYKRKVLAAEMKTPERACKVCKTPLGLNRWKYCSDDCAAESKSISRHWTQKMNFNKSSFRRFNFRKAGNSHDEFGLD